MIDVSQLREMEQFLNSTLDYYLVLDLNKNIILKSSNFDKKFYSFDSIEDFSKLLYENKREQFVTSIKNLFPRIKTKVITKDNEDLYLNWVATSFDHQNYIFYRITDNTELVKRQKELITAQELLNKALDYMPGPVYTKDRDGRFLYVNSEFYNVIGKDNEYVGKTNHDVFPSEVAEDLYKNDLDVIENNKSIYFRERVPHADGSTRDYDTYKFPLLDQEGKAFAVTGISIDVTQKLKMEEELEEKKARIVQSSKLSTLGEMAGGIAHEINTPLSIIKANAYRISRLIQKQDIDIDEIIKSTEGIDKTVFRISSIIKGLRNFARDGELDTDEQFNLKELIEEVLSFSGDRIKLGSIQFDMSEVDSEIIVNFKRTQLSQVLLNLLNNAIDAIAELPSKWIKLETKVNGDSVLLSITDSGNGIPKDLHDKILQPFFTTKPVGSGTGIGLSISSGIMKANNCELILDTDFVHTKFDLILKNKLALKSKSLFNKSNRLGTQASIQLS